MKLELKHKSFERKQDSPVEKLLDSLSPLSLMILLQIRKLTKTTNFYKFPTQEQICFLIIYDAQVACILYSSNVRTFFSDGHITLSLSDKTSQVFHLYNSVWFEFFSPQSLTLLLSNHNMRHLLICTAHYFRTLRGNFVLKALFSARWRYLRSLSNVDLLIKTINTSFTIQL